MASVFQDRQWQARGERIFYHPVCLAEGQRIGTISQDTDRFSVVQAAEFSPWHCDFCGVPFTQLVEPK